MTYAVDGLIEASDINGFLATNTNNFNGIWAVGSGNKGYGQTAISQVAVGDLVAAGTWSSLITNIKKAADHQGTTITSLTAPTTGDLIAFLSALSTNIDAVVAGITNAAAQSPTSITTSTYNSTWSNALTFTITVDFGNNNAARYFFNAGGQLGINSSHPAGTGNSINQLISDICAEAGTVWTSSPTSGTVSLAGISYTGVTKVGGGYPAGTTTSTNSGFYAWSTAATEISKQYGDWTYPKYASYTADTFRSINVSYNGSGVITFTVLFDEIPNGALVSTGTQVALTVRPPSSSYLSDTWGTPTITITSTGS